RCSSGTYVRSLADDLGRSLGGGAHLRWLRRTAVGAFRIDDSVPLDSVTESALLPPAAAVSFLDRLVVGGNDLVAVRHGRQLDATHVGATGAGPWAVLTGDGALVAVYEAGGQEPSADAGMAEGARVLRAGVVVDAA